MRRDGRTIASTTGFWLMLGLGMLLATVPGETAGGRVLELVRKGDLRGLKSALQTEKSDEVKLQGLVCAITNNKVAIAAALIESGPDLGTRLDSEFTVGSQKFDLAGDTVLHLAASLGRVEIVKTLLKAGAPVNVEGTQGRTPLDAARAAFDESQSQSADGGASGTDPKVATRQAGRLQQVIELLEAAGGRTTGGGGTIMVVIPVILVVAVVLGVVRIRRGKTGAAPGAKAARPAPSSAKAGWLEQAATLADRFGRARWTEFCQTHLGGPKEGASEELASFADEATARYFPKAASFRATYAIGERRLVLALLVIQPDQVLEMPEVPPDGEWHDRPEIKGAVLMIDQEKIAREALAAYARLLQLTIRLEAGSPAVAGYTLKRDDDGWKYREPEHLELDLALDSRGRLSGGRARIRATPTA